MKDYDKNNESSNFTFWDVNNLSGWAMSSKLLVNDFKQVENISEFCKRVIKSYNEESDEGFVLEIDIKYWDVSHNFQNDLLLLPKRMKIERAGKLVANLYYID